MLFPSAIGEKMGAGGSEAVIIISVGGDDLPTTIRQKYRRISQSSL